MDHVLRFEREGAFMSGKSHFSLEACVANYKAQLIVIIAELFKLARIVPGEVHDRKDSIWNLTLPLYCWQRVLELLIPAESAMRRLIVMAGYDKVFVPDLRGGQPAKSGGAKGVRDDAADAGPDEPAPVSLDTKSGPLHEASAGANASSPRPPHFDMFDPLKTFAKCRFFDSDDEWEAFQAQQAAQRAANPLFIPKADPLKRMEPVNALGLWKRIQALNHAAEHFDEYVLKYVNWYARQRYQRKNNLKVTGRKRLGLMRGGSIPGYIEKGKHAIHKVVGDVHIIAWDCLSPPKYRWDPPPG
jgi:hypothetical protein